MLIQCGGESCVHRDTQRPWGLSKEAACPGVHSITKRGGALALDSSETWKLASKPRLPHLIPLACSLG